MSPRILVGRRWLFLLAMAAFFLLRQGAFAQDACCGGSGCCGGPPDQACTLAYGARGVVRDSVSGNPIADATIAVLDLSGASAADGSFEVSGSRPDTCHLDYYFSLIVTAPGYEPYRSSLYTSAMFSEVTIELDPTDAPQVTVSGIVAEFPHCGGAMRGVTVILEPLNLITRTSGEALDGGRFAFHDVPPGDYSIRVLSGCTPTGCWEVKRVNVDTSDVNVSICLASVEPEPSPTSGPCLFPTPPLCPVGQTPNCPNLPCDAGCFCESCPACPDGLSYSGAPNRCECVDTSQPPTPTATPDLGETPRSCPTATPLACPDGESTVCDTTVDPCGICECRAVPQQPSDTDTSLSPDVGGGCTIVALRDDDGTMWSWPLLLIAAVGWRFRSRSRR